MTLEEFFKENPSVALGFSGGVDSSYLLYAAQKYGAHVKAYFVKTAFQPEFELQDAYKLAKHIGAEIVVLEEDILNNRQIAANPANRCYFCKKAIFSALRGRSMNDGFNLIIDGTNASDDIAGRPGIKALAELSVRSPLRECSLTKNKIRLLSEEAGLFTWSKPAYSCLATRIPHENTITKQLLQHIEAAEAALLNLGFIDFRVRVYGESARLQIPKIQMVSVLNNREKILEAIKPYFPIVLLDLEGR